MRRHPAPWTVPGRGLALQDRSRPYQAQLDQAEGQVKRYQAQLDLAQTTYDRYKGLGASEPGAVSKQALDQFKAQVAEAEATLQAGKAGWRSTN